MARADDDNVILKNGTRLPISDHRTDKSFDELIEHPDIDDMFYVPYPAGSVPKQPPKDIDPGRVRFEPLFVAMYGDCRKNDVAHGFCRMMGALVRARPTRRILAESSPLA